MRLFQRLVIEDRTTNKVIKEQPVQAGPGGTKTLESLMDYVQRLGGVSRVRYYWSTDVYWGTVM